MGAADGPPPWMPQQLHFTSTSYRLRARTVHRVRVPESVCVAGCGRQCCFLLLQVKSYPGMFRVIAWALNGLELDVHNAEISTDAEGIATNRFWLTVSPCACPNPSCAEIQILYS